VADGAPRVPLDEALAWANLSFLGLFLGVVFATLALRSQVLLKRDRWMLAIFACLLASLIGEYWARQDAYGDQRGVEQEYEVTLNLGNEARVLGIAPPGWDPAGEAESKRDEVRAETNLRLLHVQSITSVLMTLLACGIGGCLMSKRRLANYWAGAVLAAALGCSLWASTRVWQGWLSLGGDQVPTALDQSLISAGPGIAMAVVGLLLLYEYRRLSSLEGTLLSVGMVLYGVLQFSEIGERLSGLDVRGRELYRFMILSLALGLRLSVLGAVVKLPLVRASREQFQRSMESVPGGAALSTLRADGVLVVRDPDEVTRRLPLRRRSHGREDAFELDLKELEGEWGYRFTRPGAGSAEFLASPPDSLTLLRVLLVPLPVTFLGEDHLLLTFEAESLLRILPRARLGLLLARASSPGDETGDLRVWWCNDHVAHLLGTEPRLLCGKALRDLVHADWRRRLADVRRDDYSSVLAAVEGGDPSRPGEFVRITACPFGEDGERSEMLLMMISSLSSDSHTHTDFLLHNLAHTLRTPIQLVRGALGRTIADLATVPDDEVEGRLRRIRAEATRLEHAVDLNLQVGRDLIERGEEPARFSLARFVQDEIVGGYGDLSPNELAPVVKTSRAKLRRFRELGGYALVDVREEGEVEAHRAPFEVMLRELVENALHYARADGPPPRVTVRGAGSRLAVEVTNELEAEDLQRHDEGLARESQGLSCVRFLSVRYGHPFHIRIARELGACVATIEVQRSRAALDGVKQKDGVRHANKDEAGRMARRPG
jgi:signal transduction histidine kinase